MAREIKFRAWNPNDCEILIPFDEGHGDWWWFDSDENGNPVVVIRDIKTCHVTLDQDYKITHHPEFPIMQYTGLTDKNGKEIYEGDVVQIPCDRKCIIKYADHISAFVLVEIGGNKISNNLLLKIDYASYEVIGNIHENPELI